MPPRPPPEPKATGPPGCSRSVSGRTVIVRIHDTTEHAQEARSNLSSRSREASGRVASTQAGQVGDPGPGRPEKARSQKTVHPTVHSPHRVRRSPGRQACCTPYGTQSCVPAGDRSRTLCTVITNSSLHIPDAPAPVRAVPVPPVPVPPVPVPAAPVPAVLAAPLRAPHGRPSGPPPRPPTCRHLDMARSASMTAPDAGRQGSKGLGRGGDRPRDALDHGVQGCPGPEDRDHGLAVALAGAAGERALEARGDPC